VRRGEIWWADLPPPGGTRPIVLLSRDEAYAARALVIVAVVTTRIRDLPTEVALNEDDGLARPSVINLNVIQTIEKSLLRERISLLRPHKLKQLDAALRFALGLR